MPVFYGSPTEASAALFSKPSNAAMQYVNQTIDRFSSYASSIPTAIGQMVMDKHRELMDTGLSRKVEAIRHKINNFWEEDCIRPLPTVGDIQQAPDSMVRWIMANPTIRNYYHEERVEGFGERYIDREPEYVGKDQYDYRRVMDGMVVVDKETKQASYSNFHEEYIAEDVVLTTIEKATIKMAWDTINDNIDEGDISDPTSEWNGVIS